MDGAMDGGLEGATAGAAGGGAHPARIGKYRIDGVIGVGAMGVVYRAFDDTIRREVALKTIRRDLLDEGGAEDARGRFLREVQAAARCQHPNVVTIYDFGEIAGQPYIVMEMCVGRALSDYLRHAGRFDAGLALYVAREVLAALAAAHGAGIVHRDIKPGNILLLDDGAVKVTDFGIARLESSTLTQHGSMIGTPSYMSPEQFAGRPAGHRADLYAVGVLLFEMLSGRRPFEGGSSAEIMYRVTGEPPPDLAALVPDTPAPVAAAVARALAKAPEARFPSAVVFAAALDGRVPPDAGDETVLAPPPPTGESRSGYGRLFRELLPTMERRPAPCAAAPATLTAGTGTVARGAAAVAGRGLITVGAAIGLAIGLGVAASVVAPGPVGRAIDAIFGPALPLMEPYQLSLVTGPESATLSGHAPSPEAAAAMTSALAAELLIEGKRMAGALVPARGEPNERWPSFAPRMVAAIRPLANSSLLVIDDRAIVAGMARWPETLETVRAETDAIAREDGYALDFRAQLAPQSLEEFDGFLQGSMLGALRGKRDK